jgi:hypothetical protein
MSKINGGQPQTFRIEYRTTGEYWGVAVKDIVDPGFEKKLVQKISGLTSDTIYEFRVKSVNEYGDSDFGNILKLKTKGKVMRLSYISNSGILLS